MQGDRPGRQDKMRILENLEPKEVFYYFEEICNIPHGSGNIDAISDYLKKFAASRGLSCIQDEMKNIIIVKEAAPGYEQEEPVMLQGHMDMVAVKKPGASIDMAKEGLHLAIDGDKLYAQDTSLGGDDGIAVAYALALLDAEDIPHPRLEIVITVDEEVGMDGARGIDLSMLKSRRLINLDSEEEGIFWTSCAGGARVNCSLPLAKREISGKAFLVSIKGLQGGHSGTEIDKERGNANVLMGRLLWEISKGCKAALAEISGGLADNAIPRETHALLYVAPGEERIFKDIVAHVEADLKQELAVKDPDVQIEVIPQLELTHGSAVCGEMLTRAAALLLSVPTGVQAMSADIEGLVETSLNLGILSMDDELHMEFSVRSSLESAKAYLIDRLKAFMELAGGSAKVSGDYPGWAYRQDSPLREKMVRVYESMYGKKPEIAAIHAGLECGIISAKVENLDCVSLGPDMKDIHTTEETLSISSTKRVWEYLLAVLREKEQKIG